MNKICAFYISDDFVKLRKMWHTKKYFKSGHISFLGLEFLSGIWNLQDLFQFQLKNCWILRHSRKFWKHLSTTKNAERSGSSPPTKYWTNKMVQGKKFGYFSYQILRSKTSKGINSQNMFCWSEWTWYFWLCYVWLEASVLSGKCIFVLVYTLLIIMIGY
jgi:hypothetical protein